jgi:hypothetical protein
MSSSPLLPPAERVDNPGLGVTYWCVSGFVYCLNFLAAKLIYQNHPTLDSPQFLVYRSTLSLIILIVVHNKNLKYIMKDSIPRDCYGPLATRTISGNFAIFVNFMAVKYFPLTLVSMV